MARLGPLLRAATFLLVGTQALHHLRFLVAPDHVAGRPLTEQGHGEFHLALTGPAIGVLIALLLAWLVVRAAGAPPDVPVRAVRLRRVWPLAAAALLASYGSQELLEGALGHGHEGGPAALAEDGGWVAMPLAVALGALVALSVRIARAADGLVVTPAARIAVVLRAPAAAVVRALDVPPERSVFSLERAGRGPPVAA